MAYINYATILACFLVASFAYLKPSHTAPDKWFRRDNKYNQNDEVDEIEATESDDDQDIESSEQEGIHTSGGEPGRVQIKVYRGPYDEYEQFAPYGFWVKQPADGH